MTAYSPMEARMTDEVAKPELRWHEIDIMAEEPMTAGDMAWYAVKVVPREEIKAAYELKRDGWDVFCPYLTRWVRKSRYTKSRTEKPFALIPRYVFIGHHADMPVPWFDVCAVDNVIGPLGNNGQPSVIRWAQIQPLMDDVGRGRWRAPNRDKRMTDRFLKIGDLVPAKALRLPIDGERELEVTSVRGVKAMLSGLGLLGLDVIEVDMRNIDASKMRSAG